MQRRVIAPIRPISLAYAMLLQTTQRCRMAPKSLRSFTTRVASAPAIRPLSDVRLRVSPNTRVFSLPSLLTPSTGAVGYGVNENILSAYNFLVNNYTPGDELFFFGFSRGSFTCRSLAGMISKFGILKQEEAGTWFSGIWDRYQGTDHNPDWEKKKDQLTWNVNIKLLGCWDTVGSLGIPESSVTKFLNLNSEHAFHDTELSSSKSFPHVFVFLLIPAFRDRERFPCASLGRTSRNFLPHTLVHPTGRG